MILAPGLPEVVNKVSARTQLSEGLPVVGIFTFLVLQLEMPYLGTSQRT